MRSTSTGRVAFWVSVVAREDSIEVVLEIPEFRARGQCQTPKEPPMAAQRYLEDISGVVLPPSRVKLAIHIAQDTAEDTRLGGTSTIKGDKLGKSDREKDTVRLRLSSWLHSSSRTLSDWYERSRSQVSKTCGHKDIPASVPVVFPV